MDIAASTFEPLVRRLWMRAAGRVRVPAGHPPFLASTVMDALHAARLAHAHGYGGAALRVLVQGKPWGRQLT